MNKVIMCLSVVVFLVINLSVLISNTFNIKPVSPSMFFTDTGAVLMFAYAYFNERG